MAYDLVWMTLLCIYLSQGYTAAIVAAITDSVECLRLCVEAKQGCDLNIQDDMVSSA